jgi:hypothetical protein
MLLLCFSHARVQVDDFVVRILFLFRRLTVLDMFACCIRYTKFVRVTCTPDDGKISPKYVVYIGNKQYKNEQQKESCT